MAPGNIWRYPEGDVFEAHNLEEVCLWGIATSIRGTEARSK